MVKIFDLSSFTDVIISDCMLSGNPALRKGKPGFGIGSGYGLRFNSRLGELRIDYAINSFKRKTVYFGINSVS